VDTAIFSGKRTCEGLEGRKQRVMKGGADKHRGVGSFLSKQGRGCLMCE